MYTVLFTALVFFAQIARSLYNGILQVAPLFSCSSLPQGRVSLALSIFCQLQESWYLQYWLVPAWIALCLWLLWGGQTDVAVPAEDKLQCMVPITGFHQSSGTLQVLWFRTHAKLKESVFPSQGGEWAACSSHTWVPSWVSELAPAHLLQVLCSMLLLGPRGWPCCACHGNPPVLKQYKCVAGV